MTVKDLIDKLKECDEDRIVIMSKDSEGNSFSPLRDFSAEAYRAETTWCGEIGLEELTDEAREAGYSEEDVMDDGVKALVLWPTS